MEKMVAEKKWVADNVLAHEMIITLNEGGTASICIDVWDNAEYMDLTSKQRKEVAEFLLKGDSK